MIDSDDSAFNSGEHHMASYLEVLRVACALHVAWKAQGRLPLDLYQRDAIALAYAAVEALDQHRGNARAKRAKRRTDAAQTNLFITQTRCVIGRQPDQ
jgi:hypothetical protein